MRIPNSRSLMGGRGEPSRSDYSALTEKADKWVSRSSSLREKKKRGIGPSKEKEGDDRGIALSGKKKGAIGSFTRI